MGSLAQICSCIGDDNLSTITAFSRGPRIPYPFSNLPFFSSRANVTATCVILHDFSIKLENDSYMCGNFTIVGDPMY